MPGQDGMCTGPADGERASEQMPDASFQRFTVSSVVDWKVYLYGRNFNISHNPVAAHIQKCVVVLRSF